MQRIRRILVAVKDTKARSAPAVLKGAQLARRLGARLELFHVIDTPIHVDLMTRGGGVDAFKKGWRKETLQQLERMAARVRSRDLDVSVAAEWDYPSYEGIVRHAQRRGAGMIVVQRHAGRHLAPWLLHMTDWELIRLSPVPVLIVKSPRPYRRPVVLAALDPSHVFAKPAKLDEEILRLGRAVSGALGGTLHAVHAYVPMPVRTPAEAGKLKNLAGEIAADAAARARAGLEHALRSVRIPASRRHLVGRPPIVAIPEVARRTGSAIVAMGAISRSGLKAALIGNTAERVLDDLHCDILVVKPRAFVSRVPHAGRGVRIAAAVPMP